MKTATMVITVRFADLDTTEAEAQETCKMLEESVRKQLLSLTSPAIVLDDDKDIHIDYTVAEVR